MAAPPQGSCDTVRFGLLLRNREPTEVDHTLTNIRVFRRLPPTLRANHARTRDTPPHRALTIIQPRGRGEHTKGHAWACNALATWRSNDLISGSYGAPQISLFHKIISQISTIPPLAHRTHLGLISQIRSTQSEAPLRSAPSSQAHYCSLSGHLGVVRERQRWAHCLYLWRGLICLHCH